MVPCRSALSKFALTIKPWLRVKREPAITYVPIMCLLPCAPETLLQWCAPPCKCYSYNLKCTELCVCGGEELCKNLNEHTNPEDFKENMDNDENFFLRLKGYKSVNVKFFCIQFLIKIIFLTDYHI